MANTVTITTPLEQVVARQTAPAADTATSSIQLEYWEVNARGRLTGNRATIRLEYWALAALGGGTADIDLEYWDVSAAGVAADTGAATARLEYWSVTATGIGQDYGETSELELEYWSLDARGGPSEAAIGLQYWQVNAEGTAKWESQAAIRLEYWTVASAGVARETGQATLELDYWRFGDLGRTPVAGIELSWWLVDARGADAVSTESYVINTTTGAISRYTVAFRSYFCYAGRYYGVSDAGEVFLLEGADDDGVPIQMVARGYPFGDSYKSSVTHAYVVARAPDGVGLGALTDESDLYYYKTTADRGAGLKKHRVRLGRGLRAEHWAFEIRNLEGGELTVQGIEVPVYRKSRRTYTK